MMTRGVAVTTMVYCACAVGAPFLGSNPGYAAALPQRPSRVIAIYTITKVTPEAGALVSATTVSVFVAPS